MNVSTSYRPSAWPRTPGRGTLARALALVLLGATLSATAREPLPVPRHAVIGVEDHHLQADYWIGRLAQPQRLLLDAPGVAAQNARMRQQDRHVHDLEALPATLTRANVRAWLDPLSAPPTRTLYDVQGREFAADRRAAIACTTCSRSAAV